jgi:hypothetical protein
MTILPSGRPFQIGRHIQSGISSIGQRSAASVDADSHTTDQVAHADSDTGPEERVTRVVAVGGICGLTLERVDLGGEDDGHDDAVDGDDFAEDDGDEVLGANPRGPHASAENG